MINNVKNPVPWPWPGVMPLSPFVVAEVFYYSNGGGLMPLFTQKACIIPSRFFSTVMQCLLNQ
jgi:hypothetical protein